MGGGESETSEIRSNEVSMLTSPTIYRLREIKAQIEEHKKQLNELDKNV